MVRAREAVGWRGRGHGAPGPPQVSGMTERGAWSSGLVATGSSEFAAADLGVLPGVDAVPWGKVWS